MSSKRGLVMYVDENRKRRWVTPQEKKALRKARGLDKAK